MTLTIRPASSLDLEAAVGLLQQAELPTADLSPQRLALIAEKNNECYGVIGLERFGQVALLRSLVVSPDARGAGIGPALVTALESLCSAEGIRQLWLLTIDADAFFEKLGYATQSRDSVPEAIRNTEEFSGLCPGDAYLMSKSLVHP